MRLVLPVMYCKESSVSKMENYIPLENSDYIVYDAVFYSVDTLEYIHKCENQCVVSNSSGEYRVALPMKEVDKRVMKQKLIYGAN